ncbi:trypsin-like peptidase domain-containing protein [Streptomyces sp. NPDC056486]|uniref:trypsin-like peptidase domain-containing protein n=1 Tax=Streptomyces sp. NPDC056486 TaxID=3345835 RepID=UPI0036C43551
MIFRQVPLERVTAVVAELPDGRRRWGSGFLVTPNQVLTAWHCTVDDPTRVKKTHLEVRRWADNAWQAARVSHITASYGSGSRHESWGLDIALLTLEDAPWASANWDLPLFARVDHSQSGELADCVAIGYPMYMLEPNTDVRSAEVRGFIRQGEGGGAKANFLVLRDEKLGAVQPPRQVGHEQTTRKSPWGGLSGALVFHQGYALGHVVQHRPHLGNNPLVVVPIDRLARAKGQRARHIATALGLSDQNSIPTAIGAAEELSGLVELLGPHGDLPVVADLTPYQLGADPTEFGDIHRHGDQDPYVSRTAHQVDHRLQEALCIPGQLVLLVGPSKAGKTRTAFEGLRAACPEARLAKPDPARLASLVAHPRIAASNWPLAIWLDDLQRFLVGEGALTPARLTALRKRPGPTIVLATLRQEERARLNEHADLTPGTRQLLDNAAPTTIALKPTSADPEEQAAAAISYPGLDLTRYGLAEQLAGAPALLRQYTDAFPVLRAVLQAAIDWQRIGIPSPVPELNLRDLAQEYLRDIASYLDPGTAEFTHAIEQARTPPQDPDGRNTGRVAGLLVERLDDATWKYTPYPYLVDYDDGQNGETRPIPDWFWTRGLSAADTDDAPLIGTAAYNRGNIKMSQVALLAAAESGDALSMRNLGWLYANETSPIDLNAARNWYQRAADRGNSSAMRSYGLLLERKIDPPDLEGAQAWYLKAAALGNTDAMNNLGYLLSEKFDPLDLEGAQTWYRKAAEAGHTDAMFSLGYLMSKQLDPPDLEGARTWYLMGAEAGNTDAMNNLGNLLSDQLDPPDLESAQTWYRKAAATGNTDAMFNLGYLLADKLDPPDLESAQTWYRKAAATGHTNAMFNLGNLLADKLDPPDLEGAQTWYRKAADAGHTNAMFSLGYVLAIQVDPPDLEGAQTWYRKAADAGNTIAMNNLGYLLAMQLDPPNLEGAQTWYRMGAEAGNTNATNNLGNLLSDQLDPPDLESAQTWYRKAADAGNTDAMFNLGYLLSNQLDPPNLESARTWYRKAAETGNTNAMNNLGYLLSNQLDPPNLKSARTWYRKAAETGDTGAMFSLGNLLSDRLDPPDLKSARTWYRRAAEAGDTNAMFNLGYLLADRLDPPDLENARAWYRRAAEAGNTDAMNNLGYLLAEQLVPPDPARARTWYRKAAAADHTGAMNNLGNLLASQGDKEGAVDAWRRVLDISDGRPPEILIAARLSLAALATLDGDWGEARVLLEAASHSGSSIASRCRAVLDPDLKERQVACEILKLEERDTDALNFVGLALHEAGDKASRGYWVRSAAAGDTVSPLLLHLTSEE